MTKFDKLCRSVSMHRASLLDGSAEDARITILVDPIQLSNAYQPPSRDTYSSSPGMLSSLCYAALLPIAVLSAPTISAADASPIVDLGYAQYRGLRNDTTGYFGLKYAAAPVGALRWQPPIGIEQVSANTSNDVTDATTYGPQCYQFYNAWSAAEPSLLKGELPTSVASNRSSSEDCLLLDVLVPTSPKSSRLPVVVQIHGGGYNLGSTTDFDGTEFVSYSNGSIIYVQIQYRLGPYGFLAAPAVRANGTANAGLLDQKEALAWIQRNIEEFGGDASKVTIFGGSAGGGSVAFQLILHGGDPSPPYWAAIPEYPWWQPLKDDAILTAQYQEVLKASGCSDLGCLRDLDSVALYNASQISLITGYEAGNHGYGDFYYGPAVDGVTILSLPSNEYELGHYARVPMLVDHNGFEGLIFTNFSITQESELEPDLQQLWPLANQSFFNELFQLYPESAYSGAFLNESIVETWATVLNETADNAPFYQRQTAFGDFIINCPTWYMASALTASNVPVYKLTFAAGLQAHGATGTFLLLPDDTPGLLFNSTISAYMKDYFLSFAITRDPNVGFLGNTSLPARPNWPLYSQDDGSVLSINQTTIGTIPDYDAGPRCQFFKENTAVVRN